MSKTYEVGYQKPPKQTRFKKGQSGNPNGRPKGVRNLKTELMEELGERITVTESGQTRRFSKQRAILKRLTEKALKGDARSASIIINLVHRLFQDDEADDKAPPVLSAEDAAILEGFLARNRPAPAADLSSRRRAPTDKAGDRGSDASRPTSATGDGHDD